MKHKEIFTAHISHIYNTECRQHLNVTVLFPPRVIYVQYVNVDKQPARLAFHEPGSERLARYANVVTKGLKRY